jgi:uncharacterized protein
VNLLSAEATLTDLSEGEKPNEIQVDPLPVRPRSMGDIRRKDIFIWVIVSFVVPGVFVYLFHHKLEPDSSILSLHGELPMKLVQAFFVALGTYVVSRLENRPLAAYGVPPREAFGARFWEGCVWGFAMLSLVLLVIRLTGHFQIDSVALSGGAILKYGLGWALAFYGVAISEEFIFRGYLLFLYTRRLHFWWGALILSCLFGVAHLGNPNENAVGFHMIWDWAQTFFYGTPDSGLLGVGRLLNSSSVGPKWLTGGSAGPEGSIVAFIVLLLFALLVHLRFPNALYPDAPTAAERGAKSVS